MDRIQHTHVESKAGLKLHVAECGTKSSKAVLCLHGFPEIWYSWRHQMIALANSGYRAIAIDFRGYGLSDQPQEPEKGSFDDLVADILTVLDSLQITKAFLLGKDFGGIPAFMVAALHPERVLGVITLGVPFIIPGPDAVQTHLLPNGFYEPGRAEADFGRFDVKTVVRNIYILFLGSELQVPGDDQEIMDLVDPSTPLPSWFSEDDLATYASLYEKSGFRYPLQVPYRSFEISCGITDPKIIAPSLLVMGEKDYGIKVPGMEDYMRSGMVKHFMPNLEIKFMAEGNHFVQEQLPEQVNQLIISFLDKQFT